MVENEPAITRNEGPIEVTEAVQVTEEGSSPKFVVPTESDRELLMGKIKGFSIEGGSLEQRAMGVCSCSCGGNGEGLCSCSCADD